MKENPIIVPVTLRTLNIAETEYLYPQGTGVYCF